MKKIAVLTSGGDAPGMNAAIRSVVRYALANELVVAGVQGGLKGLVNGDFIELNSRSVANIIHRGGTFLRTARSPEFKSEPGLLKAKSNLEEAHIDGLILIGGDGTFRGGIDLAKVWKGQIIGVPGTIDNDLYGTDETIGFDTAVNTAKSCVDKIRDTADAHDRLFLIEVMGRNSGFIAQAVGIATGAEDIIIPEVKVNIEEISKRLIEGKKRGKSSGIIIVAEGSYPGGVFEIANKLKDLYGHPYRVAVLGHLLRGGAPTVRDRVLAIKLGAFAVKSFIEGKNLVMVGMLKGDLVNVPLKDAIGKKKALDQFLQHLQPCLSR